MTAIGEIDARRNGHRDTGKYGARLDLDAAWKDAKAYKLREAREAAWEKSEAPEARGPEARAARDAVAAIRMFPDLEAMLTRAFDPGVAMFLHQLVYWFTRDGVHHRWEIFKTADEMLEERGLSSLRSTGRGMFSEEKPACWPSGAGLEESCSIGWTGYGWPKPSTLSSDCRQRGTISFPTRGCNPVSG